MVQFRSALFSFLERKARGFQPPSTYCWKTAPAFLWRWIIPVGCLRKEHWENSCRNILLSRVSYLSPRSFFIYRNKFGLSFPCSLLRISWSLVVIDDSRPDNNAVFSTSYGSSDNAAVEMTSETCAKTSWVRRDVACCVTNLNNTFTDEVRFETTLEDSKPRGGIMSVKHWCSERVDRHDAFFGVARVGNVATGLHLRASWITSSTNTNEYHYKVTIKRSPGVAQLRGRQFVVGIVVVY